MEKNQDLEIETYDYPDIITFANECSGGSKLAKDTTNKYWWDEGITLMDIDVEPDHPLHDLVGFVKIGDIAVYGMLGRKNETERFYVVLYVDEKNNVRGYIPKTTNSIDLDTGLLLGTNKVRDLELIQQEPSYTFPPLDPSRESVQTHIHEKEQLIQNIVARIQIKE